MIPAIKGSHYNVGAITRKTLWFDMSHQTEADTTALNPVPDRTDNGHDAEQGTAGNRATIQTDELNGHRILLFDATDDQYELPSAAFEGISDGLTVAVVMKKRVSGSKSDIVAHWDTGSGESDFAVLFDSDPALKILDGSHTFTDTSNDGTAYQIILVRCEPSVNAQIWFDGVEATYGGLHNAMTFPFSATFTNKPMIGAWYNGVAGRLFDGSLAELVVFTDHLTDLELNWILKAMSQKWGIAVTEI